MNNKDLPSYDQLKFTLRKTISTAWHLNTIHEPGIEKWLSNFTGDALIEEIGDRDKSVETERKLALFLLCNFIYYNEKEVKHLMKLMLEKYIHVYFSLHGYKVIDEKEIDDLIRKSQFAQLGNKSESSAYMLYLFRQVNDLSKRDFDEKDNSENIVLVDDFSITGSQAERYIKKYIGTHPRGSEVNFYVLLMVATQDAIERLKSIPGIVDVLPCIILEDNAKAFSDESIIFQEYEPKLKELAKKMCEHYGERIKPNEPGSTPLGFGAGQYMIGTYYNTPNNSLPIFWSEENRWNPFFKRYNKIYTDSKVRLGGQYV